MFVLILQALGVVKNPLEMLIVVIAFMSCVFISMPAHEFAHAHAAYKEGDLTAKTLKRYTLAPFVHMDLAGFSFLMFFGIGFAKPVPVDPRNFKRGRRSELRVAFAGVLVNLGLAFLSCFIYFFIQTIVPQFFNFGFIGALYEQFFVYMITINLMFTLFNLLPICPLDGYRIVVSLSSTENGFIRFMRKNSFIIMLLLFFTGILNLYISYVSNAFIELFGNIFTWFFKLFI